MSQDVARGYSADDLAVLVYEQALAVLEQQSPGYAQKVIEGFEAHKRATDHLEALRNGLLKVMPGDNGNTAWAAIQESVRKQPSIAMAESLRVLAGRR